MGKKVLKKLIGTLLLTTGSLTTHAQYSLGTVGGLNIPTAEMNETGTFMLGGNFLPDQMNPFGYNTGNYFANFTLFSFVELTYRETLLKTRYMTRKPKFNQQDRSLSVRVRLLKEKKYLPALVIGANDPVKDLGNNYFRGFYGTVTKHIDLKGHEFGVTLGYMGWTSDRNVLRNGVFGGVSYRPVFCRPLCVIAEYDTRNFNVGLTAKLWNHVSLYAFTSQFDCIAGGLRFECTLIH